MEWIKVKGYKFVNPNMMSLKDNYQYKLGDNWVDTTNKPLKECQWGLHFSPTLETVKNWGNLYNHRLFKCIGWVPENLMGKNKDKLVTDHLILTEEILKEDLEKENIRCILNEYKELSLKFPSLMIGGSLSLKLQGFKIDRSDKGIGDLDLCSPYYVELYEKENNKSPYGVVKSKKELKDENDDVEDFFGFGDLEEEFDLIFSGSDICQAYLKNISGNSIKIELIVDPTAQYLTIDFEGEKYKVQDSKQIWNAKFRYSIGKANSKKKHALDIISMYKDKYPQFFK